MNEEKFDSLENNSTWQQDVNSINKNINVMREEIVLLYKRFDLFEERIVTALNEGFNSLRNDLEDLNYEVADNARATRLLKRRVARLERKDED
jgi:hypothetical protein